MTWRKSFVFVFGSDTIQDWQRPAVATSARSLKSLASEGVFQVKICGITSVDDAVQAHAARADAIGLNFHPPSPRYVHADRAREISRACPIGLLRVGLFVNHSSQQIQARADDLNLDLIQLHGDEPPSLVAELKNRPVVKAFRCSDESSLDRVRSYLAECQRIGARLAAVLLDGFQPNMYGGTGTPVDWQLARHYHHIESAPSLVLAGGLTAGNVALAIAQVQPAAVDTASGVESRPGCKDPQLVRGFVLQARNAFAALKPT